MGCTPTILFLTLIVTTVIAVTGNSTTPTQSNTTLSDPTTEPPSNKTTRRGRHLHLDIIELSGPSKKNKRQIIKIPGNVSKVKLVRPVVSPKPNRPAFNRFPVRRPNDKKQQGEDYELDELYERKVKRNFKNPRTKAQEFYQDEVEGQGPKTVLKPKRKNTKHALGDYLVNYEGDIRQVRPNYGEETLKNRYNEEEALKNRYNGEQQISAATTIHMKQVPPPNLFPPDVGKQSYPVEKPVLGKFYDDNYIPGLSIKKLPTKGRQFQSIFTQQYTSHNPHVTTNFGLGGPGGYQVVPKGTFVDAAPYGFPGKLNQPAVAASDQVVTALTPGIRVIQPPQFRDVTVSHPSHPSRLTSPPAQQEASSQRATIRDILDADCPSHEVRGYCESPPRYPMHQIGNVVSKCAAFMDVMNTQPFDEPHDVYGFGKRSDTDNATSSSDPQNWSRSGTDNSACSSDLTITEPGYAREVISGRWFVIVQHPDTTIQRVATDTCRNQGKPCGGLSGLKCAKINGPTAKSSRCVQRYTYQRLISWDPEAPDGCPRVRVFRFPSACVCHLTT